jgi:hypothetical protein
MDITADVRLSTRAPKTDRKPLHVKAIAMKLVDVQKCRAMFVTVSLATC